MARESLTQNEIIKPGEVHVGVPIAITDQIGRLEVVTDRYRDSGYLVEVDRVQTELDAKAVIGQNGFQTLMSTLSEEEKEAFMRDGLVLEFADGRLLFMDKYHWDSIPIVAKVGSGCIGSARLIENARFGLPTLSDPRIQIYNKWKGIAENVQLEFSQFAVLKGELPLQASLGLLRCSVFYTKLFNLEEWVATTDNRVIDYLNGRYMHFGLPEIGTSINYLGSKSTPIWINFNEVYKNAKKYNIISSRIASFINGENDLEGFDWYVGV